MCLSIKYFIDLGLRQHAAVHGGQALLKFYVLLIRTNQLKNDVISKYEVYIFASTGAWTTGCNEQGL